MLIKESVCIVSFINGKTRNSNATTVEFIYPDKEEARQVETLSSSISS